MEEPKTPIGYLVIVMVAILAVFFLYGAYWVAKTVSYDLFYEDMVQTSITKMVKPEALVKPADSHGGKE